jgi:hypothetical protein
MRTRLIEQPVSAQMPSGERLAPSRATSFGWVLLWQALFMLAVIFTLLHVSGRSWDVPLTMTNDSLVSELYVKSTFDHGWYWRNPSLAAPSTLEIVLFPSNTTTDQIIVRLVSLFCRSAGQAMNFSWIAMLVLGGAIATACMRVLGASRLTSFVAGALYGISPYAIYRGIDHFSLVTYLVPIPCAVALTLTNDRSSARQRHAYLALCAGCVLLGFNYVYYAFFASFVLAVTIIINLAAGRGWPAVKRGASLIAVIGLASALNLVPSFYALHRSGRPPLVQEKTPAQAEMFGLKIRHLVSPVFEHSFPPFRAWQHREMLAHFPLEYENMIDRLGVVATIGFLTLLLFVIAPAATRKLASRDVLQTSASLVVAMLLLATIGGFGSIFSLLVTPDIRGYNRVAPFIAFLSLAAVALLLDAWRERRPAATTYASILILVVGLADQSFAFRPLRRQYAQSATTFSTTQSMVRQLESALPPRAMIFQLPITQFLNDSGIAHMGPYEQLEPYLTANASPQLRWSYGALSPAQVAWQERLVNASADELLGKLSSKDFAVVLVHKAGYDDAGAKIIRELTAAAGEGRVLVETERYLALDIRSLKGRADLVAAASKLPDALGALSQGLPQCTGTPEYFIDRIGAYSQPFSFPVHLPAGETISIHGWAIFRSEKRSALSVETVLDGGQPSFSWPVDGSDVAAAFNVPEFRHARFRAEIPGGRLRVGLHHLDLRFVNPDGTCYVHAPDMPLIAE